MNKKQTIAYWARLLITYSSKKILMLLWEASSKTRASFFIRGSKHLLIYYFTFYLNDRFPCYRSICLMSEKGNRFGRSLSVCTPRWATLEQCDVGRITMFLLSFLNENCLIVGHILVNFIPPPELELHPARQLSQSPVSWIENKRTNQVVYQWNITRT